ncbi:MAG TPA: HxsD-like protein [Candidatus Nanoarchaeia archaeon]|nr:HxsD-like protein [Candidatus Nanoarchaeia archaeon]
MRRVVTEGGVVLLSFNEQIYLRDEVDKALVAFGSLCEARREDGRILLTPKSPEIDPTKLGYEVYNYVLGLMKNL